MRIHELILDNVRGVSHLKLSEVPERGVVVISGQNEAGKSTILDALWAVLFVKNNANSAASRSLQPVGQDVSVGISLTATAGPVKFRISKRYLRKTRAELQILAPRVASYTGGEAEDQLAQILSDHLDVSLLQALFVRQGELDVALDAAGIPSLVDALEGENGGESAGGGEDSALLTAVAKEYDRYFTRAGKPRGELKSAREARDAAAAELAEARAKQDTLEADVDAYLRDEELLAESTAKMPAAAAEVEERQAAHSHAVDQHKRLESARSEEAHAQLIADNAAREVADRAAQREALAEAARDLEVQVAQRGPLAEEVAAHENAVASVREHVAAAELAEREAVDNAARARKQVEASAALARLTELTEFFTDLGRREAEISAAREGLPARKVTSEDVRRAEKLHGDVNVARARLEAASAKLRLAAQTPTTVLLDGEEVEVGEEGFSRALHAKAVLDIGGVIATFEPDNTNDDLRAELARLEHELHQALAEFECETLGELRERAGEYQAAVSKVDALEKERTLLIGGKDLRQLRVEHDELAREWQDYEHVDAPPAELRIAAKQAGEQAEQAQRDLSARRAELAGLESSSKKAELQVLEALISNAEQRHAALHEALTAAEQAHSDAALRAAAADSAAQVEKCQATFAELETQSANVDVEAALDLLEGAESMLAGLRKSVIDAEKRMAERRGRIDLAEGIAERVLHAEAALTTAERKLESVNRRAAAVDRLQSVLLKHQEEARRKYAAPFVAKLSALSRSLFGTDLDFVLNENLQVAQRIVDGTAIDVGALSGGAQEQLALLTRCAVAELIDDREGVPLFIDDALGNTDKHRLVMMNRVLSNLGKTNQVFVLTSMPERFERVTGKVEWTMDQLKNPLPS